MLIYLNRAQNYYKSGESPNIFRYFSVAKTISTGKNQKPKEKLAYFIFNYVICSLFCVTTT